MKLIKTITLMALCVLAVGSCMTDEDYKQRGFIVGQPYDNVKNINESYHYANQTTDTLMFVAYNNWNLTSITNNDWVTIGDGTTTSGKGPASYLMVVNFKKNETGSYRKGIFKLNDAEEPDKAYSTFSFYQFATRTDGSLGSSPLVKSITGSDSSSISISYDDHDRPTAISMKDGAMKRDISFTYDRPSSSSYDRVTAKQERYEYTFRDTTYATGLLSTEGYYKPSVVMDINIKTYMPYLLGILQNAGSGTLTKTVRGQSTTTTVQAMSAYQRMVGANNNYVNFEEAFAFFDECGPIYNRQQLYVRKDSKFEPDNLILADTIIFDKYTPDGNTASTTYRITYSDDDNGTTNIDANQLLYGVGQCNPYALLGFMRLARFSKRIATASSNKGNITMSAELNSNKSIKTLTIDNNGKTTTYTFSY